MTKREREREKKKSGLLLGGPNYFAWTKINSAFQEKISESNEESGAGLKLLEDQCQRSTIGDDLEGLTGRHF